MAFSQVGEQARHQLTHPLRARNQLIFFVHRDGRERGGARERMAVIGQTSREHFVLETVGDPSPHANRAERHVRARQSLRHRHQIGHDVPMIHGEPFARAAEPRHHFVGDHDDPVFVAERADARKKSGWWNQYAVRADDGLHDEAGDGCGPFELNDLFEVREGLLRCVPPALDAVVGVEHVDHAGHRRLGPPARIAGRRNRAGRAAVVGTVEREDLQPARDPPRDLHRVFVGFSAAVGEEERVDVARAQRREFLAKPRARFGGHKRVRVRERCRLVLNRLDHALVAVADVHAHQLAVEVDVPLAVGRVEIDALRARHRDRVHRGLDGPFKERVLFAECDHFFVGHGGSLNPKDTNHEGQ